MENLARLHLVHIHCIEHFFKLCKKRKGHICYPASSTNEYESNKRANEKKRMLMCPKDIKPKHTKIPIFPRKKGIESKKRQAFQFLAVPLLNFPFSLFNPVSLLPIPRSIFTAPLLSSRRLSTNS